MHSSFFVLGRMPNRVVANCCCHTEILLFLREILTYFDILTRVSVKDDNVNENNVLRVRSVHTA